MRRLKMAMIMAAMTLTLAACGGNNAAPPADDGGQSAAPGADTGATEPGADAGGGAEDASVEATANEAYKGNCMACHGTDLAGAGNFPSLQQVGARLSEAEILDRIQNGGNGMPAFQGVLPDEEIQALTQWLAAMR